MLPSPSEDRADGPVATLWRAQEILSASRHLPPSKRLCTVMLRSGTYELENTFCLTEEDSGTEELPIIYRSYPGERATISGGRRVTGWTTKVVNGQSCWAVELPEVLTGDWYFTQLFVNGFRRFRPRLPRSGFFHFTDQRPEDFKGGLVRKGNGPTHAFAHPADLGDFTNPADMKLIMYTAWYETHHRVRSIDSRAGRIEFQSRGFGEGYTGQTSRYILDNVFEAMDSPGSWYLDRSKGTLYYIPFPNESIQKSSVVAPRLSTLMRMKGRPGHPLGWIRFEGIHFEHSQWDYPADCAGSLQAAELVPGAIELQWAEHCGFYDCTISKVAQYALDFGRGCHSNAVVGCVLSDLGAGGVRVGHEDLPAVEGVYDAIPSESLVKPAATLIADCTIRDGGKLFPSAVGVWIGNAGENKIRNNHIYNLSYSGISCGWIWGYAQTRAIGNVIDGNHVHHIASDDLLHDLGGIYTLGRQPGGRIRRNLIHHVGGNGVYLDEGSSELIVEKNTIFDVANLGITLHYGMDNEIRENIIAGSGIAHLSPAAMERHRSMVFHHNVICWHNGAPLGDNPWGSHTQWWPQYNLCHDLILWDSVNQSARFPGGLALEHWQAQGQFESTHFVDPLLADPASGDLSFSIDSPLTAMGIVPLTAGDVGPRLRGKRPASLDEWLATHPIRAEPIARSVLRSDGDRELVLEISNIGSVPVAGAGRLRVLESDGVRIEGSASIEPFRIEPGQSVTMRWGYALNSDCPRRVYIAAELQGDGLLSTALHLQVRDWDFELKRIALQDDLKSLHAAMSSLHAHQLRHPLLGCLAGEVRLAVVGRQLAVAADIRDTNVRSTALGWDGSCIELFAAPMGVSGVNPTQAAPGIRQVIFVPSDGKADARVMLPGKDEVSKSQVRFACESVAGGYRIVSLVPFDILGLPSDVDLFTLQMIVTSTPEGAADKVRVPLLYYDAGAFASAMHHATVRVV